MGESWDYVIVGAGSAGCVMAERLSANPRHKVLLLEAGGGDGSPLIHMPKGIGKLALDPAHAWHYKVQQPRFPGTPATETWVRGKGLGGSSSINGMIYVRGQPEDYDLWAQRGCNGWGWSEMKAAFQAIEDHEMGPGDGRGVGGPVRISSGTFRYPLAEAMIAAGEQIGLKRKADLNTEEQEGIGYYSHNIRDGRRQSASVAFLRPARARANLKVVTGVSVDRIVFEGRRAVAVEARISGSPVRYAVAGEIILSAGALVTPALLQRSGVGPGEVLQKAGVPVLADRAAVGRHLVDHLGYSVPYRLNGVPGNNREFHGLGLARNLLRYALTRSGPLATGPFEIGAFVRSSPNVERPDLQLYMSAFTFKRGGDPHFPVQLSEVEREPGMTVYGQLLRLESQGSVEIASSDPDAPVTLTPNWLSTAGDEESAVAAVRYIRHIMAQPAIAPFVAEELAPGPALQSDEELLDSFRRLSRSGTHAVGSCGMGGSPDAALSPDLRVRGVDGVRVVDCSAMPSLVSGNTNGPAMAFAWHAASLIAADAR